MVSLGATVRVRGVPEALTKAGNIRRAPLVAMRQAAIARGDRAVARYRSEMYAEYSSAWATGEIAKSIRVKVKNEKDGVSVGFTARGGERDHLRYITGILPDSHFKTFPVRPFSIVPMNSKLLAIRLPGKVRKFIQDPGSGQMRGSKPGRYMAKKVLWGSGSGGFGRDVITEVTQSEGQSFVSDMMDAVAASIASATK